MSTALALQPSVTTVASVRAWARAAFWSGVRPANGSMRRVGMAALQSMGARTLPQVCTNSCSPALTRWPAIGAPRVPRPMMPILRE